ncbi:unnamed protein product [Caenorhabditis brenneri]
MPNQPFFVPYSSQVCPAGVQTVEEPSKKSQISLFLYLFVALVLFVNRGRIARHPQISFIIGFLVLLFVGVVFASATSAPSTISTTYETVEEWVWSFWQDYVLIVDLALIVGMAVLGLVTYTCFVYWQRRRDNRNAVRPQYIIGFLVLLSVNGAVANDASVTTEEPGWLMTYYRENEKVINPVVIGLVCFAFIAFICRIFHLCCFKRPNTNNNNVSPYVNAAFVVGTDQVQFNVGHPHQVYQNPNQH